MEINSFRKAVEKESRKSGAEKGRRFGLLLYPEEDPSHSKALGLLASENFVGITHDKDLGEDGKLIKSHVHVVLLFPNPRWSSAVAKDLGISPRFVQLVRSEEAALLYLLHTNDPKKHQYTLDELYGPLKNKLQVLLLKNNKSEDEQACDLLVELTAFLDNDPHYRVRDFALHCSRTGRWSLYRRSASIFHRMIDEARASVSYSTSLKKRS